MNGYIERPATFPSLQDRSIFITGGGSGIGASLVEHFCQQGAKVSFADIADGLAMALVARLKERDTRLLTISIAICVTLRRYGWPSLKPVNATARCRY